MTAHTLPISEVFGPTIQGEGPAAGQAVYFIRSGGCNLSCSWCDTPYTWDGANYDLRAELDPLTAGEIAARVPAGVTVIMSGGEPLIHQHNPAWTELLDLLNAKGCHLHLESNGTLKASRHTLHSFELLVVSPKQAHAGKHRGHQDPTMDPTWWNPNPAVHLKIVVETAADVEAAVQSATAHDWPLTRLWVMPQGKAAPELLARGGAIAEAAALHGVRFSHRLHIMAWGTQRGR